MIINEEIFFLFSFPSKWRKKIENHDGDTRIIKYYILETVHTTGNLQSTL